MKVHVVNTVAKLARTHANMADQLPENDHDSAFGEDDFFWVTDPMFALSPVVGTKREADQLKETHAQPSQTPGPGFENPNGIDPAILCCTHCLEPCPEARNVRPAKRRASAQKVGEYHHLPADSSLDVDCQFPDDCFEKFCQECNLDPVCPPDCAAACPSPDCPEEDACFDPHCKQTEQHCTDGCVDPECTKLTCPEKPCFCQKCNVRPCPLGDPNNECHLAHSAPTPVGTVYCYDNAPCHFQEEYPGHSNGLESFETYPCFSPTHDNFNGSNNLTTTASSAATPALSHSNYTSLESVFSGELSPAPGQSAFSNNCLLNTSGDHCHIDNSCCHGTKRACGDCPSASKQQLDFWNTSIAQGNGLANNFMNFNFNPSLPTSPLSADRNSIGSNTFNLDNAMMGFNDQSWMMADSNFPTTFQNTFGTNKLDFLASAVQHDMGRPTTTASVASSSLVESGNSDSQACICKWQHAPGILCLAVFQSPEALHKHIKTAHVDNCTHCFCQWESCDASTKDFKQRSKLSRHLLGHAGYRPYACSYAGCDKTFATNQAKDNHERTHTGERPYVCDRCGYTTTTHTQLQTHISALHEGKKPHKCRFCDFTCADSSNLSKHERTHQTLRPYRCPHANCTFKPDCRWENLKRHLRRSGHCPQLLVETSEEYKTYRESVRREIDEWHKRNEDGGVGKAGRRKGRRAS